MKKMVRKLLERGCREVKKLNWLGKEYCWRVWLKLYRISWRRGEIGEVEKVEERKFSLLGASP